VHRTEQEIFFTNLVGIGNGEMESYELTISTDRKNEALLAFLTINSPSYTIGNLLFCFSTSKNEILVKIANLSTFEVSLLVRQYLKKLIDVENL